jgi:hypothetical protein
VECGIESLGTEPGELLHNIAAGEKRGERERERERERESVRERESL